MNVLIAFSPFVAFALLERFIGVAAALCAAAAISSILVVRDAASRGRRVKLLEVGSLALFGGLALLAFATGAAWPVLQVRLWVDLGLCALILLSIAIGRPFTLAYGRERVSAEVATTERFARTHRIVSLAWLAAFIIIVLADAVMLYFPTVPLRIGIGVTIVSLVAAYKFSAWYPKRAAARSS